jgi:putative flippase GtrA
VIARLRRLASGSLPRFLLVGALGELLYLALYALGWQLTGQATLAIALAGGLCLLINAVLHARVSFRVRFRRGLLVRYAAVQGVCLALSLVLGGVLQAVGVGAAAVGLISLVVWSGCSFLLTRAAFRAAL